MAFGYIVAQKLTHPKIKSLNKKLAKNVFNLSKIEIVFI
jgi:hypothetical protein